MALRDAYKNLALVQIATPPSPAASGTSLTLTAGQGTYLPAPPFNATIWNPAAYPTPPTAEIVRVTARAGDVLTILRTQEGTTARTILAGDVLAAAFTEKFVTDLTDSSNQSSGTLPDARLSANVQLKPIAPSDLPAHHTTHEPGGIDPLTNAAWTDVPNVFTRGQIVSPATEHAIVAIRGNTYLGATLILSDLANPAPRIAVEIQAVGDSLSLRLTNGLDYYANLMFSGGVLRVIPPAGTQAQIAFQKDSANSDPQFPKLIAAADTLTLSRIDESTRATLLAKGLGDTPLNADSLTSGTVPLARLPASVAIKPIAQVDITNLIADLALKAPLASPALTGTPTAPTAAPATATTQLATTAFVTAAVTSGTTTPAPHHASHETGGSDPLAALSAAILTSGTLADARLSSNVPLKNAANTFTLAQTLGTGSNVTGNNSQFDFIDPLGTANARRWEILQQSGPLGGTGTLVFEALNDLGTIVQATPLVLQRNGDVSVSRNLLVSEALTEHNRPAPLGEWMDIPFSAANFGGAGGTWTVTSTLVFAYMLVGKTLWLTLQIAAAASTISGAPASLLVLLPAGLLVARMTMGTAFLQHTVGTELGVTETAPGVTYFNIYRPLTTAYPAGGCRVDLTMAISIS